MTATLSQNTFTASSLSDQDRAQVTTLITAQLDLEYERETILKQSAFNYQGGDKGYFEPRSFKLAGENYEQALGLILDRGEALLKISKQLSAPSASGTSASDAIGRLR